MISRFTSWLRTRRNTTVQSLTFEQKLRMAQDLQGRHVMLGGKPRPVVGLREDTAEVEVRIGSETRVYDPVDLVVDGRPQ